MHVKLLRDGFGFSDFVYSGSAAGSAAAPSAAVTASICSSSPPDASSVIGLFTFQISKHE